MAEFREEDHPRAEDGKFTSGSGEKEPSQALKNYAGDNAYKYEADKNYEVSDEDIMTELSDGDYYYADLGEQEIYDLMAERLDITPQRAEEALKNQGFNFEEYKKYINGEED